MITHESTLLLWLAVGLLIAVGWALVAIGPTLREIAETPTEPPRVTPEQRIGALAAKQRIEYHEAKAQLGWTPTMLEMLTACHEAELEAFRAQLAKES